MAKIAIVADSHFGAKSESHVLLQHFDKFYQNVFFPYIEKHGIKHCIHLGDLVDRRKYINYQILHYIRHEIIERLWKNNVDTHLILGNHDTSFKNSNRINAQEELFTTHVGEEEPWIYSKPKVIEIDGFPIALLPWINSENIEESMKFINTARSSVLAGHLELSGFEMHSGFLNTEGMDKHLLNRFEMVITGHYHHKSTDGTIYYVGSPYQITWADYNDERGFHIFDTSTRKLTFIQNPYDLFPG